MHRLAPLLALLLAAPALHAQERNVACSGGAAGAYACRNVDLLAHMPLSTFAVTGSAAPSSASEIWGWTDSATGHEYALIALSNGVGFVDITVPTAPVYVGKLPSATSGNNSWRTLRVYNNYVFVGSEAGGHGVQVFDLTRLRTATNVPVAFTANARYTGNSNTHTLVVDEQSGFLYIAGGTQAGTQTNCVAGGLHIVDVRNPLTPTYAGCYSTDGYTHEAQCLTYDGPDTDYTGRQLCIGYQGRSGGGSDHVAVIDVTNKTAPTLISTGFYPNPGYTHQGWFSQDKRLLFINDEFDTANPGTRTIVMDVTDLDAPSYVGSYYGPLSTYAHNLYVRGNYVYESNYTGGLHILDVSSGNPATYTEVGTFDTFNQSNSLSYNGQWHNYPFFASGNVITSDIQNGLFVLRPPSGVVTGTAPAPPSATGFTLSAPTPNPASGVTRLTLSTAGAEHVRAEAFDALGRSVAVVFDGAVAAGAATDLTFDTAALPAGPYLVRVTGETFTTSARVTVAH